MPTRGTSVLLLLLLLLQCSNQQSSRWISDYELFSRADDSIYDTLTGNTTKISNYTFDFYSRDLRYGAVYKLLPEYHRTPDYWLFTVNITDISKHKNYTVGLPANRELTSFKWSHGSAYTFVLNKDIYYVASPGKKPIKITNSKKSKMFYAENSYMANGELWDEYDWEEGSMWFSPSDMFLAYTSEPVNSLKKVLLTTYNRTEKFDYNYEMEYAKTGEDLKVTTLSIWSVKEKKQKAMDVQLSDPKSFHYLFGASWVLLHGKEFMLATWANRWQNETTLTLCTYETGICEMLYEHKYNHTQWASPVDYVNIHTDSAIFILLPEVMEDNAWQHVAKLEISADFKVNSVSFLPSGAYDVRRIVAYRPTENIIIFDAQAPHLWNRHFYGTPAGENSALEKDRCLTCFSSNCTFQEHAVVSLGEELKIAFWCSGPSPKYRAMIAFNATLDQEDAQIIKAASEKDEEMPEMTTETFLLPSEAIVRIYHGNLSLESVPVTLIVYGGPNEFNKVTDEYLDSPRSVGYKHAIVYIDVRGSAGRGWNYKSAIFGRLVSVEVEDTLEAMKLVLDKYPRLDKNRVAVYGGSYGGTMSLALVELAPPSFFKCAISMCPVTNFSYYQAWYTERFMADTPLSSYTDLSVNVTAFNTTNLLLVHGLRDGNVLFQNSALFIEALQRADIPFELMVYPNQGHSIDRGVLKHEGHLCQSFLEKCFEDEEK